MLTQQAGHIEFGSFEFEFDRPSTRFDDLRPKLSASPEYHDHDHGHEGHHDHADFDGADALFSAVSQQAVGAGHFSIVESARIEARIMHEYPGIATAYREMRRVPWRCARK